MQYFLHIAQSQVHIARNLGIAFSTTTIVLRGEKFGSHLVVKSNCKIGKMVPPLSGSLYKLHKR